MQKYRISKSICILLPLLLLETTCTIRNCLALLQNPIIHRTSSASVPSSIISLRGGYDATIGPDPSNPIQFFTLTNGMCPYAARTLIVLHELNFQFETIEVSPTAKPDWYLKINPRGKVPALRVPCDNNEVIYESAICDEYLCDLYDSKVKSDGADTATMGTRNANTLMPKDAGQRARIRLLNDQCDTILNPAFFTFLTNKDESKEDDMRSKLCQILNNYEETLNVSGGPYLTGKEFTLADVHMLPFFLRMIVSLRHFKDFHVTKTEYPKLVSWFELCSQRDSVKIAAKPEETIIEVYQKFVDTNYAFGGLNKNK